MNDFSQLLRFLFVGGSTALLYLGLVYVFVEMLGIQVTLASTLVCIIVICYNYSMHYNWTFAADAPHGMVLVRYLMMCAGALVINALIMHFGTVLLTIHYIIIQGVAAVTLATWSLLVSSLWVFRKR